MQREKDQRIYLIYFLNLFHKPLLCIFLGKNLFVFVRCIHDSGNNQKRPPWNYDKLTNWGYDNKRGTYPNIITSADLWILINRLFYI